VAYDHHHERYSSVRFDELAGAVFAALAAAAIVGTVCLIRKPLCWLGVFAVLSCLVADNYDTQAGDNVRSLLAIGWLSLAIIGICAYGFHRMVLRTRAAARQHRREVSKYQYRAYKSEAEFGWVPFIISVVFTPPSPPKADERESEPPKRAGWTRVRH
jgi:hypothetical protein